MRRSFIVIGVISIILSLILFFKSTGEEASRYTYGGDAYTGIQNSSADTADNIRYLASITKFGLGSILLIGGLALIVVGSMDSVENYNIYRDNNESYFGQNKKLGTKIFSDNGDQEKPTRPDDTMKTLKTLQSDFNCYYHENTMHDK